MVVRRILLFAGAVALLVDVVGLLAPVSVSPGLHTVGCGSALAPDLSAARARDDRTPANVPIDGKVVADINYTRLCQLEIEDRRIWTISLAAPGALAVIVALALAAWFKRAPPPMTRSTL
ncbi:MAG: hypothetical protein K2X56_18110 [Mycobacterium pseudokansasii]|uniref:hypothetical protein n=1 Tax=Mycobacterium pseudokansasii TaxID=2341080 RepID=UPI0023EF59CC|nr:hypothetical protein [Mycobacterium pseudokansasii]MBY0389953.1 hypothetical protein [Mycobacterium pseudokansasii]